VIPRWQVEEREARKPPREKPQARKPPSENPNRENPQARNPSPMSSTVEQIGGVQLSNLIGRDFFTGTRLQSALG